MILPKMNHLCFVMSAVLVAGLSVECHEKQDREDTYNKRLAELRTKMKNLNIAGYMIPNEDDHQSETPATRDKRREFISGFTGSNGHALITMENATLWTDGRYYIQAEEQLPSFWTLIRPQRTVISNMSGWLCANLQSGDKVAIDPKKVLLDDWRELKTSLVEKGIELIALENNLVDEIWHDRPEYSKDPIYVHDLKYCGEPYDSKLQRLRHELNTSNCERIIVSALDEISWLFNLRGNDIPYSPQFVSYAIVTTTTATLYVENNKITSTIKEHLNQPGKEVELKSYIEFWNDLNNVEWKSKTFIPNDSSYAIFSKFAENVTYSKASPLMNMKAVKNPTEIEGSRRAHVRDAISLCELFKVMEEEIPKGVYWDELKVAQVLDQLRTMNGDHIYKGPSFATIAPFGIHSALPHYTVVPSTNIAVNTSAPLTLDSGGQYLDGTIDTTRVIHFGVPTEFEVQVYTALLQGVINLGDAIFPESITADRLHILAIEPLLQLGLTFPHGVAHGTGIFSNVHEKFNRTYFEHLISSQEPGYYLKDKFGMRLENLVVTVKADVQNVNNPKTLLRFEPLTVVPYERKLINTALLDFRQIAWINNYHEKIRQTVGNEMIKRGKNDLHKWLMEKTEPIENWHMDRNYKRKNV